MFLPLTFAVYFFLNGRRLTIAAKAWLALCSLFFYAYWNVNYLPLILVSILFNYALGSALTKTLRPKAGERARKAALIFGVAANLSLLGYYKYANFFIANLNTLSRAHVSFIKIILPLGISFFTFTQIAYLVDSYKSRVRERDFLNYLLFVSYFPHLIAGPIVHHAELMPQFDEAANKVIRYRNVALGLFVFFIGLFKKAMIADFFAVWANEGFDTAAKLDFLKAWTTSLSYTFQLYFDFSGYIDMAIGASMLFNVRLPRNFNSPYRATDIQDFWKRWHMTLSRFLRDYVYIPLGGNRAGEWETCRNLLVVFLLGGLWHGASWTFIFWGLLHGMAMVIHRLWARFGRALPAALGWFLTFNFVNATWVFFRAKTWGDSIKVLKGMAGISGVPISDFFDLKKQLVFIAMMALVLWLARNSDEMAARFRPTTGRVLFTITLAFVSLLGITKVSEFIYFNF